MKLYGESDAATIFFNFARLATGILDLKSQSQGGTQKKIVKNYGFIVFKMTAQNTRSEQKKSSTQNCNRAEKKAKNCQNQAVWFGWGILQISHFKSQIPVARRAKLKKIVAAYDSPYNFTYKSDLAFFICSLFYFEVLYNPLYCA